MKMLKRTLALMLALIMMFSAVPFNAYATESTDEPSVPTTAPVDAPETEEPVVEEPEVEEPEVEEPEVEEPVEEEAVVMTSKTRAVSSGEFQRILHLDCGRKYFTVDWIKALITEMSAAGYTHLQLAFGNDGLRFLLDDMSVGSYSDDDVTAAVQAGNKAYNNKKSYSTAVNELTEAEMNEIIAHANKSGIKIIPLLNNPGHMYTLITAMTNLGMTPGYNGSASTLDLEDTAAVNFVKGLLQKYVDYFSAKGCTVFNIGADEYANDNYDSGSMGFGHLMSSGKYQLFVDYVNSLSAMIKEAGMQTVVFNDGIYFQGKTSYVFDTDIMVSFWSSGWGSYYSLSAKEMAAKGHPMVNTHGDYYFILKNEGTIQNPSSTALNFDNTKFMSSTVSDPAGSTFCIWCDNPGLATEQEVAAAVRITLRKMAASMNNTDSYSDAVVAGGFNADGTLNVVVTPDPEPEEPETVTKTDEATKVAVTAPGLETVDVKENAAVVTEEKVTKTYSISLNDGAYTGEATVKIPYDTAFDGCNVFTGFVDGDEFPVTKDGEYFLCEVPHFSDVEIEGRAVAEDSVVAGSGTSTSYVLDKNGLDVNAQYLIVYDGKALTNAKGSLAVTVNGDNATPSGDAANALWTYTVETSGRYTYTYLSSSGKYLNPTRSRSGMSYTYTLNLDTDKARVTIGNNNGTYTIKNTSYSSYVAYNNEGWIAQSNSQNLSFYKYTEGTQTFKVNAALQESRITAANVANDGYTDESWNAYQAALTAAQAKLTEVKGATYNSEAAANTALNELKAVVDALEAAKNALEKAVQITIKYVLADGTEIKSEPVNVSDKATSVALSSFNHGDKFYVVESATLAITPATVTEYTVKVTEAEEDLNAVDPLVIELWQTNTPVVETVGRDDKTKTVVAKSAYSEKGIDVTTIAPQTTYTSTAEDNSAPLSYWWSRLLPLATNEQTDESGDDETWSGVAFTKVRYWNGSWAVFTANNEWQNIDLDDYQLVAYYMNDMNLADEVKVSSADWGKKGDGTLENNYLGDNHVSIAFQVVYEDGTTAPVDETAESLAAFTYLVDNWGKRGVGTIALNQIGDYQIWKVTAETGTHDTTYGGAYKSVTVDEFDWDNNELTVWEGDPVSQYTIINDAHNPSTDGAYANLTWNEKNESILIRIYIKTVETEDSLKVVYYDEKFGDTLYEYYISVNKGDNFTDDIGEYVVPTTGDPYINLDEKPGAFESNADRIDVTGFGITNAVPKAQAFQTDLTNVPQAVGKYHSDLYEYTGSVISEDGKTLYLYYNINTHVLKPNFVVDFGLPITFTLGDVTNTPDLVKSITASAKYGTVDYNSTAKTFTYTPTKVLQNVDILSITLTFDGGKSALTNVGVTPATSVYYEENFLLNNATGWTKTSASLGNQETAVLGARKSDSSINHYGYDGAYAGKGTSTGYITGAAGASTSFTFTGTGFQLYGNSNSASGYVTVYSQGSLSKLYMINTKLTDVDGKEITGTTYHGLPFISETDLPYGTYTVQIKQTNGDKDIYLDGVRILNTINEENKDSADSIYLADEEDKPDFYELRDYVLNAIGVEDLTKSDYISDPTNDRDSRVDAVKDLAGQVYNHTAAANASAVIVDKSEKYTTADVQKLLDNGPKNELYLYPNQTLTFNVKTPRVVQLGLKAPTGSASFDLTVNGTKQTLNSISSSVDMFYEIAAKGAATTGSTVSISVPANSGVLSVTLLKICDDPGVTFPALTQEDIENTLLNIYGLTDVDVPAEPEVPETPVEPEVPEETTKPTEPEVEETTKPSKPGKPSKPEKPGKPGKPENTKPTEPEVPEETTKPTEPQKPGKPGNNGNQKPGKPGKDEEKTYTLKVTFVNLFGKKVGTATITTTNGVVSASEIIRNAPAGRIAVWLIPVTLKANGNTSIVVPVL